MGASQSSGGRVSAETVPAFSVLCFTSPVMLAMINVPLKKHLPLDVDVAHLLSMLKLCDVDDDIRVTFGTEVTHNASGSAGAFLERLPSAIQNLLMQEPLLQGRPQCGGRWIVEP